MHSNGAPTASPSPTCNSIPKESTSFGCEYLAGRYPEVMHLPYPKVGTTNSAVRIGVTNSSRAQTRWLDDLPGDPRQNYIPRFAWADSSEELVFQRMNRRQNHITLWMANVKSKRLVPFFEEKSDTWINVHNHMTWFNDGQTFLWQSEKEGWRRFYSVTRDGKSMTPITKGDYDVIQLGKFDVENGWLYFIASPENPAQRYHFPERVDGTGTAEQLSPLTKKELMRIDFPVTLAEHFIVSPTQTRLRFTI